MQPDQIQQGKPAVLLMGPTASGKTGVALALAREFPLEIISVDSALIYRDMDIGTAKPSQEELAQVPHHLIDILDPAQSYSAAQFRADALRLIDEIQGRGKLPLLVGGTMLYFKALREGLDELPQADAAIRARLDEEARTLGWPVLHARLREVDPITAARLPPMDAQRIQRALEIFEMTGTPMSSLFQQRAPQESLHRYLPIALEPSDRAVLHQRIEQRFDAMLAGDFLDEVRALRARGDLHPGLPSMRCVGYRQAWEYLDGLCSAEEMRARALAATRQLAKRQLTWLRGMEDRRVFDCLRTDLAQAVADAIRRSLMA